jgi:hypothetical protein
LFGFSVVEEVAVVDVVLAAGVELEVAALVVVDVVEELVVIVDAAGVLAGAAVAGAAVAGAAAPVVVV